MKQIIDEKTWNRKDNFSFFKHFLNPTISTTSEVVCTRARSLAKENKQSFFLHYLYAILAAVNEIDELRYRITNKDGIVLYDKVDVLCPIRVAEDGRFVTVRFPWKENFEEFYQTASSLIKSVSEEADPYAYTRSDEEQNDDTYYNVILVSATPDLYFTSMTHTQEFRQGSPFPLLNVGKAVQRENDLVMPIAICVHHGFVDGKHISDFYKKIETILS